MDKKLKVFLIVTLLLCFLVFLYLRRENSRENFECVKIDKSLFCPVDKSEIDKFRSDQDPNYKAEIKPQKFYRFLKDFIIKKKMISTDYFNYMSSSLGKESFQKFNDYKKFDDSKFKKSLKLGESELLHKYDFINCTNTEFSEEDFKKSEGGEARKIMSPGGVLFDRFTDDIIIFDIYNLKRFSYRDLRIKDKVGADGFFDYYPVLDSMAIPIDDTNEIYRKELLDILYSFEGNLDEPIEIYLTDITGYQKFLKNTDKNIYEKVEKILYDLSLNSFKDKEFKMNYKTTDVEKEYTTKDLIKRIKFLVENLDKTQKFKTCIEDIQKEKNSEKVCRIKYQRDLPAFDMGDLEGKGIEGMQYDDLPETKIHSTYLDNRMTPWSNSWNNIKSEGIFSPLFFDRRKKMKIFNKAGGLRHGDGIDDDFEGRQRGKIVGIKQKSNAIDPTKKATLFNDTLINPIDGAPEKYFDNNLKDNNLAHETFSNIENREKVYKQVKQNENKDRKIHYGYPSVTLKSHFSVGVYNITDEMDSTGIGMEIVDTGNEQIILVPDLYNNRIQIFKKDRSELTFYGQFGNLPYTSERSLPMYDENHTRYEPIHDTENFNSAPGCNKTCDFNANDEYIGPKNTDMMGNKCLSWNQFNDEELKIDSQQINEVLKMDGFKKKDFLKDIRQQLKNGKQFGNKCLSLDDTKEPVCVVNDKGKNILRKCFPDFLDKDGNNVKVINNDTCVDYLKEFTSRYGPIDANNCLGDNDDRTLTPEEIKKGVLGEKDCVFECDPRFSYRRANIHQRQMVFKFNNFTREEDKIPRKRGHFYSLYEEYNRCKSGIDKEKETGKPTFLDAEFINPHFLGVDSQACVGKKTIDGLCASLDTRMTSGVDNCSLGYRKYLLKMINISNKGQNFGQLFHPKSIAYDDVDKKYYVVDCYHHCVQCFEMKPEKKNTESGEKLDFVCSDEELNNKHIYFYDENFNTAEGLRYNRSSVYALGLRQNLLYEEDLNNFSRIGELDNVEIEKEKGFSLISPNWAKKYSDTTIRLNRWVSGISEWGNHVYKGFKEKIDYKKISDNGDLYFNTEKGGNGTSPGCGEFSYPSDIAITKNSCLGQGVQVMMVTDTGNNRISIFKKYNLDGNFRFRFYSFLGDEEEKVENKTFVNPISICISEVSGCVFVLEANFYDNLINKQEKTAGTPSQRIKIYYPDLQKKNYFWSHNLEINKFTEDVDTYQNLNNMYKGSGEKNTVPRITKIRIDDRGILALTDINNNKVHLLKESVSADFKIKKIDDSALNKVTMDIEYDPYKRFKSYGDRSEIPIINHDRVRFIFQRQRVCAFQNGDVILTKEFKTGNIPFGKYKKSFHIEDIRQELEFDNCWVMNTETSMKYLPIDNIETDESTGKQFRVEVNRPNFDINKKYLKNGTLVNYEDWTGRSLEPNSSYLYKIYAYNYNFIKDTDTDISKIVQTYPLYLSDDDIMPKNIVNDKENYISLNINYDYESKRYNPICFTILRRIHNRTMDIVTKNINCVKGSKIQLFLPRESKIIFQIKSRPKLGRLYYYDIEKGGEFEKNLVELERGVEYTDNKYLIFYSCEGGDENIGGYSIPEQKTIGRDTINDTFTLGDRLETVHNQVRYNVLIDITKTDTEPIMFKDNDLVEENVKYYKKNPIERSPADLEKLVKLSYAKKVEDENYFYPGIIEYCDKGINLGPDNIRPIEMNQTYEYVILVSNPFKVNPAVNSFYYTTKPEKPYIHSVEYDVLALENDASLFRGSELKNNNPNNDKITINNGENPSELSIAKVTWYYPKNRSLYWPLNFIVLRKDVSNRPIAIKPNTYDIDFNFVSRPVESDKLFRIMKKSLKLRNNSDADASGVFKRRYDLQKQMDWRIKVFGTAGVEVMLNREKYNWSEPYIELKQTKFLDLTIKLKGQQQITNITCEETVIIGEEEDLDTVSNTPSVTVDPKRLKQLEQFKKEQEKLANQKIKEAVEEQRKSSNINFIFNLGDDYHGYYTNVANTPKTGKNGSLYRYIKDMSKNKLLDIFDELHNEMKIYHGDVGLRMDGSNGTLRSGAREMIIDKIRHFAFILREHKKSEQKAMGVECTPLELDDIKIVTTKDGDNEPKLEAIICKNTDIMAPAFSDSTPPAATNDVSIDTTAAEPSPSNPQAENNSSTPENRGNKRCSTLENTSLRGDDKQVITDVSSLAECCYKCQMSTDCEVAEFKESEKMCELHKSYDPANEIPNRPNSTLLGKEKDTFVLPPAEAAAAPAPAGEIVIPPHLSEWEIIKTNYRKKEVIANYTFRYPKDVKEKDRIKIQKEFAFEPTIVSLSSDPEGLEGGPPVGSDSEIEFSSHEVSIPIPKGKKYSYKIAVFQTGFNLDSEEKRKFMGVETKNTPLGLGEVYSNEIELGESITETIITNKPPFMPTPMFKEPKVDRPVIKFFEPKEGDANSIVRIVGLKLDELEYISFRDVKVKVLKKQERIIGNVKYQEYLIKPPSVKELDRKCWQSLEKYRALVWGYWHGYQIINSEEGERNKMFNYTSMGECKFDEED